MDTIGTIKTSVSAVSTALRWFVPAMQDAGSGTPKDRSGNSYDLTIGANTADATIWAAAGYVTATDATNQDKGLSQPAGRLAWAGNTGQSLLVVAQIKAPAPASTKRFLGDRSSGNGIGFEADSTGKIQMVLRDGTTSYTSGFGSVAVLDNTLHTLILYVDGVTKTATAWVDGTVLSQLNAANVAVSLVNSVVSANPFGYGHDGAPTGGYTVGSGWRNLHAYVYSGSIANITNLVARLQKDPFKPLTAAEL